ncbi:hypothetical protein PanWU01x14_233320 [Parasponia andersonii]|uniref:Uncharacterized protein n=1 Tax=Parasponia andersonii TaxID=3476 RepID=A0A2P5BJH4_PARAD|nr:hypothetical protein PanWU01x14_233320 [Parasponia andersonii]
MSSAGSAAPSSRSSSDGSNPKGKRIREETRGIAIEKWLRRAKVAKVKVQHDEWIGKPVLKHGKMFLNLLAKLVRDMIPASTLAWKDAIKEDLDLIFERLDLSKASSQNSENMSKQLYTPGQGSLSIGNLKTRELMSLIDCFEERHFKNNSWRNEYNQQKQAEMIASRDEALTQAQAQAQAHEIANLVDPTLSAESIVGPISIDEYAIMTQSLGTRSRWQKGVGSFPRLKNVGGPRATSKSNVATVQCEHAETITSLKQQLAEKDAEYQ